MININTYPMYPNTIKAELRSNRISRLQEKIIKLFVALGTGYLLCLVTIVWFATTH